MSHLFGPFEAVAQLHAAVLIRIGRSQHRSGALRHRQALSFDGHRLVTQAGAPRIELAGSLHPDQELRAASTTRYLVQLRPEHDPYGPWTSTTCQVRTPVRVAWVGTDPADLRSGPVLEFRAGPLDHDDITVAHPDQHVGELVRCALRTTLDHAVPIRAIVPSLSLFGQIASWASFRAVHGAAGDSGVAVGLHLSGGTGGVRANLQQLALTGDWLVGCAEQSALDAIEASVAEALGGSLPTAASPVVLSEQPVCLLGTTDLCLDQATETISLTRLDIALGSGAIAVTGTLLRAVDRFYVPDLTAEFDVSVTAHIDNGELQFDPSLDEVTINEWYGQTLDAFLGGGLTAAIADGIEAALGGDALDAEAFGVAQLASAAPLHPSVAVTPALTAVELRTDGVLVHGSLDVAQQRGAPVADVRVGNVDHEGRRAVLDASRSWAPGGDIVDVTWTIQGATVRGADTGDSLIVLVEELGTDARVCVTITDDLGRTAARCLDVQPDHLTIEHLPSRRLRAWSACSGEPIAVRVLDAAGPVPRASVFVESARGSVSESTDSAGVARLEPPHRSRKEPVLAAAEDRLTLHATSGKRRSPTYTVQLVDCGLRDRLLDELAAVAGRRAPSASSDALVGLLANLVQSGSVDPYAVALLGIGDGDPLQEIARRLRSLDRPEEGSGDV